MFYCKIRYIDLESKFAYIKTETKIIIDLNSFSYPIYAYILIWHSFTSQ